MAEVLGALASAVQLLDVALRASQEARSFLSGIRHAEDEVKNLRNALRSAEANVRSLRSYLNEFKKSKNALEEYEVLPEAITGCFTGFHDDILALKQFLPSKPTAKLAESIKWSYNRKKLQEITISLRHREIDLTNALSIATQQHGLRIREDINVTSQQQNQRHSILEQAVQNNNQYLNSIQKESAQRHAELIHHGSRVNEQMKQSHATSVQEHENTRNLIKRKSSATSRCLMRNTNQTAILAEQIKLTSTTMAHLEAQTQQQHDEITQSIASLQSTTLFSTPNIDSMTRILRSELRSSLLSIMDDIFSKTDSRIDHVADQMEQIVDIMAGDSGRNMSCPDVSRVVSNHARFTPRGKILTPSEHDDLPAQTDELDSSSQLLYPRRSFDHHMKTTWRQSWLFEWKVGTLQVGLNTIRQTVAGSIETHITTELNTKFIPNQSLVALPGFAMRWSLMPDQQGFYQVVPAFKTFPVITDEHPVVQVVWRGAVSELQEMLSSRQAHLRMQTVEGLTLLHLAALFGRTAMSEFLASHQLSWSQPDQVGYTPSQMALYGSFTAKSDNANTLLMLKDAGMDLDQLYQDFPGSLPYDQYPSGRDLEIFTASIDSFLRHSQGGWPLLIQILKQALAADAKNIALLDKFLEKGLSPNTSVVNGAESIGIFEGIMRRYYNRHRPLLDQPILDIQEITDVPGGRPSVLTSMQDLCDTLAKLIQYGLDIFFIWPESFEHALWYTELSTLTSYSHRCKVASVWRDALLANNISLEHYGKEQYWRCRQAFRLYGASRSGIDESILDPPSLRGLRLRRGYKE